MSAISRRHFIGSAAAASAIPLIGSSAHAQQTDWPTKPIKIIAGYPAGGQTDLFARTYGEYIRPRPARTWWWKTRPAPRDRSRRLKPSAPRPTATR